MRNMKKNNRNNMRANLCMFLYGLGVRKKRISHVFSRMQLCTDVDDDDDVVCVCVCLLDVPTHIFYLHFSLLVHLSHSRSYQLHVHLSFSRRTWVNAFYICNHTNTTITWI